MMPNIIKQKLNYKYFTSVITKSCHKKMLSQYIPSFIYNTYDVSIMRTTIKTHVIPASSYSSTSMNYEPVFRNRGRYEYGTTYISGTPRTTYNYVQRYDSQMEFVPRTKTVHTSEHTIATITISTMYKDIQLWCYSENHANEIKRKIDELPNNKLTISEIFGMYKIESIGYFSLIDNIFISTTVLPILIATPILLAIYYMCK